MDDSLLEVEDSQQETPVRHAVQIRHYSHDTDSETEDAVISDYDSEFVPLSSTSSNSPYDLLMVISDRSRKRKSCKQRNEELKKKKKKAEASLLILWETTKPVNTSFENAS
ncbi:uncharacterized protein LOC144431300 [Styela clava]